MAGNWLLDSRYDAGLERLASLQAQESALFAERARTLALLVSRTSREGWQAEAPFESLLLDVAGTCLLGQVAASSRLLDAEHLVVRLPQTLEHLERGELGVHQAQVVVGETRELEPGLCAEVERRVLPAAPPLCPADLRRLVRRVVLEVDAAEQERREVEAQASRRVWVKPVEDGMALLCALLPAEQAQRALAGLNEQARAAGTAAGEQRSADQLRADLMVEALATGDATVAGRPLSVLVHVPLATALGRSEAPADLQGHGPISGSHARRLLEGAQLGRACVHPDTGEVWGLDGPGSAPRAGSTLAGRGAEAAPPSAEVPGHQTSTGTGGPSGALRQRLLDLARATLPPSPAPEPAHDPSRPLARLVRARDVRCDGIGCSVPASRCELDHQVPWPAGPTSAGNLRARSQRCHHAKHSGWTVTVKPGASLWTSPAGRRYRVPRRGPAPPPAVDVPGRSP